MGGRAQGEGARAPVNGGGSVGRAVRGEFVMRC